MCECVCVCVRACVHASFVGLCVCLRVCADVCVRACVCALHWAQTVLEAHGALPEHEGVVTAPYEGHVWPQTVLHGYSPQFRPQTMARVDEDEPASDLHGTNKQCGKHCADLGIVMEYFGER